MYETPRKKTHFCEKYKGYGLDYALFKRLRERGVKLVDISVEGTHYISTMAKWSNHGIVDTLREGDGEQIFLPLKLMINASAIERVSRIEEFV